MTLSPLLIIWLLAVPFVLGAAVLRAVGLRFCDDRVGFCGWAWAAGCLLLGLLLFVWLHAGVEPSLWWTAPVFGALAAGMLAWRHDQRHPRAPAPPVRGGRVFALLAIGIAAVCLFWSLGGAVRPCIEADEGNIWSLRAKSLLVDQGPGFAAAQVWNLHADYPLLDPLLQAWVYSQVGAIVHFENRWLVQLCGAALWLALAAAVRARLPGLLALPVALVVAAGAEFQAQCRLAYADGMVALGVLMAVDGWLRWRSSGQGRWRGLAVLGLAFALWSKNETVLYLLAFGGAAALSRLWVRPSPGGRPWLSASAWLLPLAVLGTQVWFNRRHGFRSDLFGDNPTGKNLFTLVAEQWRERVPALLSEAWHVMVSVTSAHGAFAVLLVLPMLLPKVAFGRHLAAVTLLLWASLCGLHVVWVGSFLDLRFHLDTSYQRVLFQLLPATVLWCAAMARVVLDGEPEPAAPEPGPENPPKMIAMPANATSKPTFEVP